MISLSAWLSIINILFSGVILGSFNLQEVVVMMMIILQYDDDDDDDDGGIMNEFVWIL